MATTLSYSVSDFQAFTKILSADVNSRFSDIKNRLNWAGGTSATTGLGDDNIQSNTASGGGLTRATKLKSGTANYVVINDASGNVSEEAQLSTTRGGTGFNPTLAGSAGKAIVVNAGGTAFSLGSPTQSALTLQPASDIASFTAGEAITINDAVCFALGKDASNANIYRVFRCDSDLADRRYNFAGFATAAATVTAHTLTWVNSAALVTSNSIAWSINGAPYTQAFTTDNDTTLAAIATQIATHADIQSAAVVDAGSNDRQINITGKGGLQINITGAVVTAGASQATVTITTTQSPVGGSVTVRCFGYMSGFSGLTPGNNYYLSGTTGAITSAPTDGNPIFVGQALSATELFVNRNVGQFQFSTPQIFVRSGGFTGTSSASGVTTTDHYNQTSWSSGTAATAARSSIQKGDGGYGANIYMFDGRDTGGTVQKNTYSYNKTSWSTGTGRTTEKVSGGLSLLSNNLYVCKGRLAGGSDSNQVDKYNGSTWTNSVTTSGQSAWQVGTFTYNGSVRILGGIDGGATNYTTHTTFDGASASTDTAVPTTGPWGLSCGTFNSKGILGGNTGNGTLSYQWAGSWSSSIALTYAPNNGGENTFASSGYFSGSGFAFNSGGGDAGSNALTTSANFNGSSWSASTAATARSASTGGCF